MLKAYKYRLYPNREQQVLMEKHFGCSRFVFNWALALQKRYYAMFGKSLSRTQIQRQLVRQEYSDGQSVFSEFKNVFALSSYA